jgi:excisionase family DNA binding protein
MSAAGEGLAALIREIAAEVAREAVQTALASLRPGQAVDGYIGTREAARRAGVKQSTVLGWIGDGRLRATKPDGVKGWRIRSADLERLLTGHMRAGEPPPDPVDLTAERGRRLAASFRSKLEDPSR